METKEVRDRFKVLSDIDDRKHHEAFPGWRFQPKQPVKWLWDDEDLSQMHDPQGLPLVHSQYADEGDADAPPQLATLRPNDAPTWYLPVDATTSADDIDFALLSPELVKNDPSVDECLPFTPETEAYDLLEWLVKLEPLRNC
jgi:hypothetical protein